MKLKNLKVARWPFFIFHFLFNPLKYKRNNDRYKRPAVLIFIFDKVERQVHIGSEFNEYRAHVLFMFVCKEGSKYTLDHFAVTNDNFTITWNNSSFLVRQ